MFSRDHHGMVGLTPDEGDLTIRLLGRFSLSCNGTEPEAAIWRSRNATRLVQILALATGHHLHREQICEWFWPTSGERSASNNFHQVLHHARRALTSIGLNGTSLLLDKGVLSLNVPESRLWIDVDEFESAAGVALQTRDPSRYEAALSLYDGELLPEERFTEWAAARRDALHATHLSLLYRLGDLYVQVGNVGRAEEVFTRLLLQDEAHEAGQAGLMRILATTGRRHQALERFEKFKDALRRDLDIEPGHAILNLRDSIRDDLYPDVNAHAPTQMAPETPFVGRNLELQILRDAVERSFSGSGGIVVLTGEPGAGKTRTAREACAYARRSGSTTLWGTCYLDDVYPAYWPWVQIIRQATERLGDDALLHLMGSGAADIGRILPEIRDRFPHLLSMAESGAEASRFQLFDSITRFFRNLSLRAPLVIVFDDLHWGDQSSLMLLSFFARETARWRVLLVCTFRESQSGAPQPFTSVLAEARRHTTLHHIPLGGLTMLDVQLLLETALNKPLPEEVAANVYQRADGNPLFVGEMLQMMRSASQPASGTPQFWETAVPLGVRDVIRYRLEQLSGACQSMLSGAAIIGRDFEAVLLARLAGHDQMQMIDTLEEAIDAHIVERTCASDHGYRFTHVLIQESVYASIPSSQRVALHRRAAEAIEQRQVIHLDERVSELAYHYAQAAVDGNLDPALYYGVRAGERARERIAYAEAIDHFQRTLQLVETHAPDRWNDTLDLLLMLGNAHNHIGNRAEARATFMNAANIARAHGLPEQFARAALGYAGLGLFAVNDDQRPLLEEAVGWLPTEDSELRAQILARLAFEIAGDSPLSRVTALCDEAEAIARRLDTPAPLVYVLIARNWSVETMTNLDQRIAISRESLSLIHDHEMTSMAAPANAMYFYDGFHLGDMSIVDRQIDAFQSLAEQLREPQRIWLALILKLTRAVHAGEFDEADRLEQLARDRARNVLAPHGHDWRVTSQLVEMRREQGRLDEITPLPYTGRGGPGSSLYRRALDIHIETHQAPGPGNSLTITKLVEDILCADPDDLDVVAATALVSTTVNGTVAPHLTGKLLDHLAPHVDKYVFARVTHQPYGAAAYYAGLLASAAGEEDCAIRYLELAVTMNAKMGARPYLARSQHALADQLSLRNAPGDTQRAGYLLQSARAIAASAGMPVLLNQIDAGEASLLAGERS